VQVHRTLGQDCETRQQTYIHPEQENIRFAVTTPRGIEFHQDVLVVVDDDIIVIMCHNDRDWTLLLLGDGLRLDTGLDLAIEKVGHEFTNLFLGDLLGLVEGEFLVFDCFLNRKGRPGADFQIQVASVGTKRLCINGSEVDFTLELLGERL
jgi:hypothetical protein